jgi:hypothetical protein
MASLGQIETSMNWFKSEPPRVAMSSMQARESLSQRVVPIIRNTSTSSGHRPIRQLYELLHPMPEAHNTPPLSKGGVPSLRECGIQSFFVVENNEFQWVTIGELMHKHAENPREDERGKRHA